MILILSTYNDISTDEIMDWLYSKKMLINRINDYNHFSFYSTNTLVKIENTTNGKIGIDSVQAFLYRRGYLSTKYISSERRIKIIEHEYTTFIELIYFKLSTINHINKYEDHTINKLIVYDLCKRLSILCPKHHVISNITDINLEHYFIKPFNFLYSSQKWSEQYNVTFYQHNYYYKNNSISKKEFFLPTFFQEYIPKKYEIRSFYLKGQFRSMAIFSQQNEKTKYDFRNYDHARPNRNVPYKLPKNLEKKLHKLMLKLDINCGSMDIIVTPDDQYYFLEVNPIGQFQWLSKNCNYFIERMMAKNLAIDETWSN
ncbi:MAG: grasp-with-spasm system ATP-grasp peptide maturase [Chitinophagaceae bacterium]